MSNPIDDTARHKSYYRQFRQSHLQHLRAVRDSEIAVGAGLLPNKKASRFSWEMERYSYLKATIGSTLVARRAGMRQAASATRTSSALTTTIVMGS